MKIDRRSFLAFIVGGAAGTALSPLPWKLTDDLSIWTQRWPWTPIPPGGSVSHVSSTCLLCRGGCGILVKKVDDRVIKVEGMPGHPVNDGGICPLGLSAPQLLYAPTRVKAPMKKVNGRFRTVSWDDALEEIAAALSRLRDAAQPHTVAAVCDSDRGTVPELFKRFLTVYGSPNFIRMPSILDNYELTLYLTQGVRAMPGFDMAQADFVLSFGSGVIEGWMSPGYMFRAKSAMTGNGGKLAQIEPRLSKTAAKADNWVPLKPGTEGDLALGIAHVLLKRGSYRRNFAEYAEGFDGFARMVAADYAPEKVSAVTGVDIAAIGVLADQFARARRPLAVCGRGGDEGPAGSLKEFMAVHFLNALAGRISQPGGIWAVPEPDYVSWPDVEMDAVASAGMQQSRVDGAGSAMYPHARYLLHRLPASINSGQNSPVQVLFISGANPVYEMPDASGMAKAIAKIPLVVSFSSFMDETAMAADFILPNHMALERLEDVPAASGYPKPLIGLAQPAVAPLFDTRHTGDVLIQLAKRLPGPVADAFYWESYEACLEETLGDKWDALAESGYLTAENFVALPFETSSGKFEFSNREIAALPAHEPLKMEGGEGFPLVLIPFASMRLPAGPVGAPPFLVKALEDTILSGNEVAVEVNPATAREIGLADGKVAVLETPRGKGRVRVRWADGIMPGLVALPKGLGHTAYGRFLAGKGVNFNDFIAPIEDPASGYNAAWGIGARLSRA